MDFSSKIKPKSASIEAIITRKDGTVENLGTISYYHRNPLRRWFFLVKLLLKQRSSNNNKG